MLGKTGHGASKTGTVLGKTGHGAGITGTVPRAPGTIPSGAHSIDAGDS